MKVTHKAIFYHFSYFSECIEVKFSIELSDLLVTSMLLSMQSSFSSLALYHDVTEADIHCQSPSLL
jgi:hypothetical protein